MVSSEANSSLLDLGLGTGGTKGERGLAVPSQLLAVPVPGELQHPTTPPGLQERQAAPSSTGLKGSKWL